MAAERAAERLQGGPAGGLAHEVARRYAPARLLVGLGAPGLARSQPQVALQPLQLAPSVAAMPPGQVEPLAPSPAATAAEPEPASPGPASAWYDRPWPFTVEQVRGLTA